MIQINCGKVEEELVIINVQSFFINNMSIIYFIYGLAFFTVGLSLALQSRKDSDFVLSKSLWMLAGFGFIHSLGEWAKMYVPLELSADTISSNLVLRIIEALIVSNSFMFLFLFGINLLIDSTGKYYRLKYLPFIINGIWLIKFVFWDLVIVGVDDIVNWTFYSTTMARYLLALPGSFATGIALLIQASTLREFDLNSAAKNCKIAGISFLLYSFFSGLVVLPVSFWPGNFLNTETFFSIVGLPVQIFRALLGLVIALTISRIINMFNEEQSRRLAQAKQQSIIIQERERFSRDLHDGIMQSIYSVGLVLKASKLMLKEGETETLAAQLDYSENKLNETVLLLRNYIGDLHQVNKEEYRLKELLENLGQEYKGLLMLNLKIETNLEKDIFLTPTQANYLSHIVKEALFNIIKHAHASKVKIQVLTATNGKQENINVLIIDDGIGFDFQVAGNKHAAENLGLANMKFRAQRLHGSLEIITAANIGTKISLTFPVDVTLSGVPLSNLKH